MKFDIKKLLGKLSQYEIKAGSKEFYTTRDARDKIASLSKIPVSDGLSGAEYVKKFDIKKESIEAIAGISSMAVGTVSAVNSLYEGVVNGLTKEIVNTTTNVTEVYNPVTEEITTTTETIETKDTYLNHGFVVSAGIALAGEVIGSILFLKGLGTARKLAQLNSVISNYNVHGMPAETDTSKLEREVSELKETQKQFIGIAAKLAEGSSPAPDATPDADSDDDEFGPEPDLDE